MMNREVIKLSLVDTRVVEGTIPLFPADYYEIPNVSCFQDISAAKSWALKQISEFAGQATELYINGGLAIEMLSALWALETLSMSVRVFH